MPFEFSIRSGEIALELGRASPAAAFSSITYYRDMMHKPLRREDEQPLALLIGHIKPERRFYLLSDRMFYDWAANGDGEAGQSCWVSPKGMVYPVAYAGHSVFYADILGSSDTLLLNSGWVHVSGCKARYYAEPTASQRKAVAELAGSHVFSDQTMYYTGTADRSQFAAIDRVRRPNFNVDEHFASLAAKGLVDA